jgi:hypothetical protein
MPAPGWDTLAVKDDTKAKVTALEGLIVRIDGKEQQLRTENEIVSAAADCLTKHARRRQ